MKRAFRLSGLLRLLAGGPVGQQYGCLQAASQALPPPGAPAQLQPRTLASAARPRGAAAAKGKAAADTDAPAAAAAAAAAPRPTAVASGKQLSARTRALLAREQLVASFALQLGLPVEWAEGPTAPSAAEPAEAACTAAPPSSLRSAAEALQEKRESRWKRRPPEFPSYEVFDAWMSANAAHLEPLRAYLSQDLGLSPGPVIQELFRRGPAAQAMMMPDWQPPANAVLDDYGAETEAPKPEEERPKSKKGKSKDKGRMKKSSEAAAEQEEAQLADQGTAGRAGDLEQPQQVQQGSQEAGQEQVFPRLAAVAAEWQEVLAGCGLPGVERVGRLAQRWPGLLVTPPPGGPQEALARLRAVQEMLRFGAKDMAALINAAPQIFTTSVHDVARRLELLRHHAHVAAQKELEATIRQAPQLLWVPEAQLMENTRTLVKHCRSTAAYSQLVRWMPDILLASSRARAEGLTRALEQLLPQCWSAADVMRARPQLLLHRPHHVGRNWQQLTAACAQVPVWQEELERLLSVPSAPEMAQPRGGQQGDEQQQQQHEEEEEQQQEPTPFAEGTGSDAGGPAAASGAATGQQKKAKKRAPESGPSRRQYYSIARLLDARPDQIARLHFLQEIHPDAAAAGEEPLVQLVTMRPRVFERNFPGMDEWLEAQRCQREASAAEGSLGQADVGGVPGQGEDSGDEGWFQLSPRAVELAAAAAEDAADGDGRPAGQLRAVQGMQTAAAGDYGGDGPEAAAGTAGGAAAAAADASSNPPAHASKSEGAVPTEPGIAARKCRQRVEMAEPERRAGGTGRGGQAGSSSGRRGRGRGQEGLPSTGGGADIGDWWDAPLREAKQ